ncbi:hypothetical protein ZWY2020_054201 [Hordeum vulgare]|nr:hypothetical protein ZWY2020_054201 [Hordeum vulgare]
MDHGDNEFTVTPFEETDDSLLRQMYPPPVDGVEPLEVLCFNFDQDGKPWTLSEEELREIFGEPWWAYEDPSIEDMDRFPLLMPSEGSMIPP